MFAIAIGHAWSTLNLQARRQKLPVSVVTSATTTTPPQFS